MRLRQSIQTQLTAYIGLFLLLVVVLGIAAIISVSAIDRNAEAINNKWLAGTRQLGEIDRHMSDFRLAETDRALALNERAAADAETSAVAEMQAVEEAFKAYASVVATEVAQAEFGDLRQAWDDYLVVHDAWLRADAYRHAGDVARSNSSLHWRYKVVDQAIDALRSADYRAASAQSASARKSASVAIYIVWTACFIAVFLAAWIFRKIRSGISRPLGAITAALSSLAAGSMHFSVPEVDREDEIGEMAKAFEVFRCNAAELEKAHAATRSAEERAHLLARHDALTGLPNRRVFANELGHAIERANAGQTIYAVLLIDLDRFKPVNDVQGHAAGDQVLCAVARRIETAPSEGKTVARLGGDEFALIVKVDHAPGAMKRQAMDMAAFILGALAEPIEAGGVRVEIGASIGIAFCPADGCTAEDIIRAADIAMCRAKQDGRGDTFRFFEQSMDEELRAQSLLEESFRGAVRNDDIVPYYQPLVDLNDGRICGFEVLARWFHPELGAIPPDRFIAMAERLGLIADVSASILRQACRDSRGWKETIRFAVNVSPYQLADPLFATRILAILSEEGLHPSRLEVEITESALVGDISVAREALESLQSLGVTVSLDDFGTGYSSLYHLRHLKFDRLKIDRSFVQSLRTNAESAKIVDAVLGLARSLGMSVVAEGIEDRSALEHLTVRGCEFGQGYLFSPAVAAPDVARLLQSDAAIPRAAA